MPRLLIAAIVTLALFPAAFALMNACSDRAPSTTQAGVAQQRFRTNFCYNQYRSQSDVVRCLSQGI
jgi:hypothetical protein